MAGVDFRKVRAVEQENLESILNAEKDIWRDMPRRKKIARRLKNKFIRDFNFRDNGFEAKEIEDRPRIVVYTCITGGYDKVAEPTFGFGNIEYVLFTDSDIKSEKWEVRRIPGGCRQKNLVLTNRYVKMHPQELFAGEGYEYSIYIDGNLMVVGDLTPMVQAVTEVGLALHRHSMRSDIQKEVYACIAQKKGDKKKLLQQLKRYKAEGFPKKYGMLECNVIVAKLNSGIAKQILGAWWKEFIRSGSMRDQIALPYVLWKAGYMVDDIGNLGYNVYRNPKLRKLEHAA